MARGKSLSSTARTQSVGNMKVMAGPGIILQLKIEIVSQNYTG